MPSLPIMLPGAVMVPSSSKLLPARLLEINVHEYFRVTLVLRSDANKHSKA